MVAAAPQHAGGPVLHVLAQAERPHISPDFLDVVETLGFQAAFAGIEPAQRVFSLLGPDRILLFVIDDDFVDRSVFFFVPIYGVSLL